MPRADQAQGEAQPGQPAGDGPGRRERAGRRPGPARREHALGPGLERRDAAEARGAAVGRSRRRRSAAGSSAGPRACPTPPRPPGRRPASDHWAFAPPSHPRPPAVRDGRRVRGPVDRFIQRALEDRGLTLGPDADRATLIRRLAFDLTGLPPSPAEIAAFVDDPDPDAYERLVDRLLASPDTASAGASTGSMPRATPTPTGTSAPTPTGRWPTAIAITSSARSTPIGRSTGSSASNWPATSWPAAVAGRARRPRPSTNWSPPTSSATARTAPARATATRTRSAPTSTPCSRGPPRSSARRCWG